MDKVDRIIEKVRQLREEGMMGGGGMMTTKSDAGVPGFSEKSPSQGPTAGISPKLGTMKKRYATGGHNSRKPWLDYLKKRKSN